jgi:hypothetical protein
VSTSILSRSMAIARLPNEITSLIGGPEKITFRLGKRIDDLIEELGIEAVVRNAANLRPNRSRSTHDLLAALEMEAIHLRATNQGIARQKQQLYPDRIAVHLRYSGAFDRD